jgi:hypothetical protein
MSPSRGLKPRYRTTRAREPNSISHSHSRLTLTVSHSHSQSRAGKTAARSLTHEAVGLAHLSAAVPLEECARVVGYRRWRRYGVVNEPKWKRKVAQPSDSPVAVRSGEASSGRVIQAAPSLGQLAACLFPPDSAHYISPRHCGPRGILCCSTPQTAP